MFSSSCCFFPRRRRNLPPEKQQIRAFRGRARAKKPPLLPRCSDANVYAVAVAVAFVLVLICTFAVVYNISAPTTSLS